MTLLSIDRLSVCLRERTVLRNVSFKVEAGECIGILGPNGAGKTTLMRAALGLIPHEGESSIASMTPEDRARMASWLPQTREIAWPMTVERLVVLGRIPHMAHGQRPTIKDQEKVNLALSAMNLDGFRDRTATRLSGGEQVRVLIARVLAQDTPLIMADEPVAGLDPAHQISTMQTFSELARSGRSVIIALHELGLAVRHCTRLILLSGGNIVADGLPSDVLTLDCIAEVFGIEAFYRDTEDGPIFQPLNVIE